LEPEKTCSPTPVRITSRPGAEGTHGHQDPTDSVVRDDRVHGIHGHFDRHPAESRLRADFALQWLKAYLIAWPIAGFTAFLVMAPARRITDRIVQLTEGKR
jgi:hypothetical protein